MFSVFYRFHRISLCRFFGFLGIVRASMLLGVLFGVALAFGGCGFKGDPYFSNPSQTIDFKDLGNIDTRVE